MQNCNPYFKLRLKTLTLISVHSFQVHHMPHNVVLITDAVAAQHVPAVAGNVQGLATGITLQEADHLWGGPVCGEWSIYVCVRVNNTVYMESLNAMEVMSFHFTFFG